MNRSFLFALAWLCVSPVFVRAQEPAPTEAPAAEAPAAEAAPVPVVASTATEEIKALVGKTATVEGTITRVGSTTAGGITFINFGGGGGAFVAVVFKANYEAFPEGFDKYKGQTVRVTGPVKIFKETTPQIEVKAPDQIQIVAPPAPAEGAAAPGTGAATN